VCGTDRHGGRREFVGVDAKMTGLFRSSKRFSVVGGNDCRGAVGSGVAGDSR